MNLLYLGDYKRDEETVLSSVGVRCQRLSFLDGTAGNRALCDLDTSAIYEVRGRRLSLEDYTRFHAQAEGAGVSLGTSPRSYEIVESFALHYPLLRDLSPRAIVVGASESTAVVSRTLEESGLQLPVFVRSEIESAAKYVGTDGCILWDGGEREVASVVRSLRAHVHGFRSLIFKEVAPISIDPASGRSLEYRAIGLSGCLLLFDFGESGGLPDPESLGLQSFAEIALASLARGGADGGIFLDIALTDARPVVVECKNLINGTISEVWRFGERLKSK